MITLVSPLLFIKDNINITESGRRYREAEGSTETDIDPKIDPARGRHAEKDFKTMPGELKL